jgi:hypothetical protein
VTLRYRRSACAPLQLLELPPEVLQQIFESMVIVPWRDHLNMLMTCRRIFCDSYTIFLGRPLLLGSQVDLIAFVKQRPDYMLSRITSLTFCLEDLGCNDVRPYLAEAVRGQSKTTALRPYHDEVDRVTSALSRLQNLSSISILRPCRPGRNHAPRFLSSEVINYIVQHLSKLQHLRIDYDAYSIAGFTSPKLRSLQITGCSDTTPVRTLDTLSSLHQLHTLRLIPAGYTMRPPYFRTTSPCTSITPLVLQHLQPLRSLTLSEPPDSHPDQPIFVTPEMLKAVALTHAASLQSLTIASLHPLSAATAKVLAATLLSLPVLTELELALPDISLDCVDALPRGLKSVGLLVSGRQEACLLSDRLMEQNWRLEALRSVEFSLVSEFGSEHDDGRRILGGCDDDIVEQIGEVPWTVMWKLWNPFQGGAGE